MTKPSSDALAIAGALAVIAGMGMLNTAAGVIVLGVFLLLGALATAHEEKKVVEPAAKAPGVTIVTK